MNEYIENEINNIKNKYDYGYNINELLNIEIKQNKILNNQNNLMEQNNMENKQNQDINNNNKIMIQNNNQNNNKCNQQNNRI